MPRTAISHAPIEQDILESGATSYMLHEKGLHFRQRGLMSEQIAARTLQRAGYRVIKRNYRTRCFEIDIIARHEKHLIFVEVRGRRDNSFVHPLESITPSKKRRLQLGALHFMQQHQLHAVNVRFDIVVVTWRGNAYTTMIYPGAFEL